MPNIIVAIEFLENDGWMDMKPQDFTNPLYEGLSAKLTEDVDGWPIARRASSRREGPFSSKKVRHFIICYFSFQVSLLIFSAIESSIKFSNLFRVLNLVVQFQILGLYEII
jgi:hypothetical protein